MDDKQASETSEDEPNTRLSATDDNSNNGSNKKDVSSTSQYSSKYSAEEARNQALQRELENVRNVNKVIEDATASLEKAKNNMEVNCYYPHLINTLVSVPTRRSFSFKHC